MTPADISIPCTAAQLRAAAAYLNGGPIYGALRRLAMLTGTPPQSIRHYATGARPVPRHLAISVRNLVALQATVDRVDAVRAAR